MTTVAQQTLQIVSAELAVTLESARAALERGAERADDAASFAICAERLHEIRGVLRVVEVDGAALLAEEMEYVARYLQEGATEGKTNPEGIEALMRAMVQLPAYLDRVVGGGRDLALILLPLLNDLRAVRVSPLLSEGTLLLLNLSSDRQAEPTPLAPGEPTLSVSAWARRLRPRYQVGLLGYLRNESPTKHLQVLATVAERIEHIATHQSVFQLWWVVGAFIEALLDGGIENGSSVKRLMGQTDRELKRLFEEGETVYAETAPLELINNILYYISRAKSNGPRLNAVRASFKLQELLPVSDQVELERESLSAPSVKLMHTVAEAIKEDLGRVKDVLDIFVRKGGLQVDDLATQLEMLRKISDTLGVLGLGELRQKIQAQAARLADIVSGQLVADQAVLVEIAANLISVEDNLDAQLVRMIRPEQAGLPMEVFEDGEFRLVRDAVLRECMVNLSRVKEIITAAITETTAGSGPEQVAGLLRGVQAGLLMLSKPQAVDIVANIGKHIAEFLPANGPNAASRLDRLADAIVSLEYYMETLQSGRADPWYMLENAEMCLRALGAPVIVEPAALPPTAQPEVTLGSETWVHGQGTGTQVITPPAATAVIPEATPVSPATSAAASRMGSVLATATASANAVLAERDNLDPELVSLFVEEAREEIARIQSAFPAWSANPEDADALTRLRRSFHTLKGSGRMIGARTIGEFTWSVEALLNRVINGTLRRTTNMMDVMAAAIGALPRLVDQLETGLPSGLNLVDLSERIDACAQGLDVELPDDSAQTEDTRQSDLEPPIVGTEPAPLPEAVEPVSMIDPDALIADDDQLPVRLSAEGEQRRFFRAVIDPAAEPAADGFDRVPPPPASPDNLRQFAPDQMAQPSSPVQAPDDPVLREIYRKEVTGHLATIGSFLLDCEGRFPPYTVTDALHRSSHTLAGASKMAEARQGIKIAVPLNDYIRKLYDHQLGMPEAGRRVLADASKAMEFVADHLSEESTFFASQADLLLRLKWLEQDADREINSRGLSPREEAGASDDLLSATGEMLAPNILMQPTESTSPHSAETAASLPINLAADSASESAELTDPAQEPTEPEYDPEIAAIFSEEATELLEAADASLGQLRAHPNDQNHLMGLARVLHTLKGGARMAGVIAMGDLAHEFESLLVRVAGAEFLPQPQVMDVMQEGLDALHVMREQINQSKAVAPAHALINRLRSFAEQATPEGRLDPGQPPLSSDVLTGMPVMLAGASVTAADVSALPVVTDIEASGPGVPFARPVEPAPTTEIPRLVPEGGAVEAKPAALPPGREAAAASADREVLARVDAELLDDMLNSAGEVSIFRARLEQQFSSVESNLGELGRVVLRLKDQMRKLESETEAQILNKHEGQAAAHPGFDPLELDRYSSLQQYSRALAECVSDVESVQSLLESQSRDAQTLLMQQARLVTDLQNGLMRTRMVPFQRHAQRLIRVVRQVASESGKQAELLFSGASGELDRQVLERMLPPFEHLLRNAVVHGIETPELRRQLGKPEAGRVEMALRREGSEVVIVVKDDGAGMNLKAIRDKAISLGMLDPRRSIADEDLVRFVLEPGFSTAAAITQVAGRGVGMDVVANEIKKLGGALHIETQPGGGTQFTIRLPFTLAISQALIVRIGVEVYALPLPTVEGVVRLPKQEVLAHLADDQASFEYAGQRYRFQHLGAFVGGPSSQLPEADVQIPVVLVRAGESSTALVTDELLGSREIVVKSVGPQISSIRGISGATILGDGRVVIILDIGTLVRGDLRSRFTSDNAADQVDRRTFALVVDDSITVRRVTQRLLERNGMRVMTAKDGIDAMAILQEHLPDIILLDIEMPRMDGYEVASQVRGDPRLAKVPIVMITSRSGEKHRAHAIALGVDDYLGKPYQENELLDAIEPLVRRHREAQ